jgi:RNA polymerase sigma-70 factor (ECF subfamily)
LPDVDPYLKEDCVSLTDSKIAKALQQGDESVFEQVFKTYYECLCNYANTFVTDMDEAEEVVQSTFLLLWEKRAELNIQISVKSYLYQSVRNRCLNQIKHNKVRQAHGDYVKYVEGDEPVDTTQPILTHELEGLIADAVESLPPQCGKVFRLSRFEELSYAEIADQLNIAVKTVENQMGKALRIMRMQLKDYFITILLIIISNIF